jgi:probable rRNA maturation factor
MSVEPNTPAHVIAVQVDEQFQAQVRSDLLHRAALATLTHHRIEKPCELALVVTGDAALHELNLRHRGVDAPTDVLAFGDDADDTTEGRRSFVGAPDMVRYIGDVVISLHRAEDQANEAGHDVQAELQLLVVHGVLHLLGYDDVAKRQRAQMWAVQAEILQSLEVEVHLPANNGT